MDGLEIGEDVCNCIRNNRTVSVEETVIEMTISHEVLNDKLSGFIVNRTVNFRDVWAGRLA